jgi:Lrp/AsnC family leucine-responsive transcriptional regulator
LHGPEPSGSDDTGRNVSRQSAQTKILLRRLHVVEDLDRRIVEQLSADGRMSYTDLGKALGMSTSAVHQRVRRLEQRGVLKGYTAQVDPVALGLPMTAFISVTPLDPAAPDDIPDRLRHLDAVEECHSVAGDEHYILKVRTATPTDLEELIGTIRAVANVSTRTTVVLSTPWE